MLKRISLTGFRRARYHEDLQRIQKVHGGTSGPTVNKPARVSFLECETHDKTF